MTYKEIAVREYYLHTLSLIGLQLSVTFERALFYEEVRRLSVTDPLTKLSNRRAFIQRLEEEFKRSVRYRTPLSMAICDLDDFKRINDRYGHQAGDLVLIEVSKILMDSVREVDLAGRWGGEEIALIFPQTKTDGAMIACERIRKKISELKVPFPGTVITVTMSIGISTVDPDETCPRSVEAMMGLADHAMYLAKQNGKNRVASSLELDEKIFYLHSYK
ncbi:MAG: GGDEF domain-containing protein, partial [bacterium]|nr:GGDEF domain-containing protein [bacterium]